jgi:hypothetical protein
VPHHWGVEIVCDVIFGGSLLPVIAAIRRGTTGHRVAAILLSVLPLFYIYLSLSKKLPLSLFTRV